MAKIDVKDYEGVGQIPSIFSMYLPDVADDYPHLRVLSADMSYGARLERFKALYPQQFINVGIAEQNLIGVCAGLSAEGYKCVAIAQATFITMRCFEQVRQYLSYMGYPIILIGINSGLSMQFMGNTHYAIEDLSIMRSIPNLLVLAPSDSAEAVKAFDYALKADRPVYIRLNGCPDRGTVWTEDFDYNLKGKIIKDGTDMTILSVGSMVPVALEAAQTIEEKGLTVRVVDMLSVSPFDKDVVKNCCKSRLMVTIEEHYITGGLGSAVAETISEGNSIPLLRLGIGDRYSVVGDYDFLLEQHRLTAPQIVEDILEKYSKLS